MHRSFGCAPVSLAGESVFSAELTMTKANGVRLFTVWNGAGNKHEVPRSYSAAEESAASWTERRDDEGWKIGKHIPHFVRNDKLLSVAPSGALIVSPRSPTSRSGLGCVAPSAL
jgi:hypothetical protein